MICRKLDDIKTLPKSCSVCSFLNETILKHGGVITAHSFYCELCGIAVGSTDEHMNAQVERPSACPLIEI